MVKDLEVINIELKSPLRKDYDFAGAVLECVLEKGLLDKVIFSSFDIELIVAIKKKCIDARVGLLTMFEKADIMIKEMTATFVSAYAIDNYQEIINKAGTCKDIIQLINSLEYKPDFWHPDFRSVLVNPSIVSEMNQLGIGVNPYTVDDKEQMLWTNFGYFRDYNSYQNANNLENQEHFGIQLEYTRKDLLTNVQNYFYEDGLYTNISQVSDVDYFRLTNNEVQKN